MKYKLLKDYYHRVKDKLWLIPKDTILEPDRNNCYNYTINNEIGVHRVQVKKSMMESNPELFELIEDKMTWEELEAKLSMLIQYRADFMGLLQKHCILIDEYITQKEYKTVVKVPRNLIVNRTIQVEVSDDLP